MAKFLPKIIYHSGRAVLRAIYKSLVEEVELSREAAKVRYQNQLGEDGRTRKHDVSLDEAMKILNVNSLDQAEIHAKYKTLFEANSKRRGGSFYLQSKVVRAKERLDAAVKNQEPAKLPKSDESGS